MSETSFARRSPHSIKSYTKKNGQTLMDRISTKKSSHLCVLDLYAWKEKGCLFGLGFSLPVIGGSITKTAHAQARSLCDAQTYGTYGCGSKIKS